MNPQDREPFLKVVIGFAELKGKKLSSPALELYWHAMQDWSIEDFNTAAQRLIKTSEFMPTPKDFEDLRKAGQQTGGEAFANVRQWLKYTPHGYTLKDDTPPRIASSIRAIGGPDSIAMCDTDKLHFLEKRFCEHYEEIGDRMDTREAVPAIAYGDIQRAISGTFKRVGRS